MPTAKDTAPFDFDGWAKLARTNPDVFEIKRKNALEAAIRQASPQNRQRLLCLQWQLDQIRNTSRTPLAACMRMQRLLFDKLTGEAGLLALLQGTTEGTGSIRKVATILPFRRH